MPISAGTSCRSAENQLSIKNDILLWNIRIIDLINQQFACLRTELVGWLCNSSYRRNDHAGKVNIIKSHNRNILRDGKPLSL